MTGPLSPRGRFAASPFHPLTPLIFALGATKEIESRRHRRRYADRCYAQARTADIQRGE